MLDPVTGVGTETGVQGRIKTLYSAQQAQIAFFDQIRQVQALADIVAGYVDDEAEVGADHGIPSGGIAPTDQAGQLFLLGRRKQRRLIDFTQVGLQRRLGG